MNRIKTNSLSLLFLKFSLNTGITMEYEAAISCVSSVIMFLQQVDRRSFYDNRRSEACT